MEKPGLRAELELAARGGSIHLLQWASAKGYSLSRQDAEKVVESLCELSDDELDKAAGGDEAWGGSTGGAGGTGGTGGGGTTPTP